MTILNRKSVLFIIATLVLWLNFSAHLLTTLPLKKFLDGEFPSERYVFSRLVYNLEHGIEASGGFMLRYDHADELYKSVERQDYADFKAQLIEGSDVRTSLYLSHAGLQDNIVFPIWSGLEKVKGHILEDAKEGSRWHKRLQTLDYYYYNLISQTLIALVNALVLSLFILWVASKFSPVQGWLVLGMLLLFAPVLTFFGRSMWWMMWSWFLPMLITLWGVGKVAKEQTPGWGLNTILAICTGIAVFVKTAMGYEFSSTVMVAALVPVIFFALSQGWRFIDWFRVSTVLGIGCVVGFVAAFAYHWHLIELLGKEPWAFFQSHFEMRAYGGETLAQDSAMYKSTQASFFSVLLGYIVDPKELTFPQILLMLPFLHWCFKYYRGERKTLSIEGRRIWDALSVSITVSFLGGTSMLLILKGHAYIHGFDIAIWMIPLNLFLFTFYALRICPDKR